MESAFAGAPPRSPLPLHSWAIDALIAIPLILIQTGAEEALFRGYLMQQLFARFRSMLIRVALPTVLFGLLHWNPEAPGGSGAIMLAAGFAGFALALLTIRTGNLYMAWGYISGSICRRSCWYRRQIIFPASPSFTGRMRRFSLNSRRWMRR